MELSVQIVWLFILAIPVASIAWTVTQEELFREPRQFCIDQSRCSPTFFKRKFFYLFTCEYCFSHYVAVLFLAITHYHLLFDDWRGYIIAGFSLVWLANIYISIFALIRQGLKKEKLEADRLENQNKGN